MPLVFSPVADTILAGWLPKEIDSQFTFFDIVTGENGDTATLVVQLVSLAMIVECQEQVLDLLPGEHRFVTHPLWKYTDAAWPLVACITGDVPAICERLLSSRPLMKDLR